jgi:DNA-binding MarR family transcriptional regulator
MSSQLLSSQESSGATQAERGAVDAWVRLLRGHAGMRRAVTARLQADHGLTVNEYEAMLLLSGAEDERMRRVDLADSLQLTPSGVTRMLDGLRERGLVEKAECSNDARVAYAVLTGDGAAKLRQASCSHVAAIKALFEERYTGPEIETFAELLGRLPGAGSDSTCKPHPAD